MVKIIEIFPDLVDIAFSEEGGINNIEQKTLWMDIAHGLFCVHLVTNHKHDFTDQEINRLQEYCDAFCEDFR